MCGSSRPYLHCAHVENKAVVACVLRGTQREPKSGLGMHPGLSGVEILLGILAFPLSLPGSQLKKWLKEVSTGTP